MKVTIQQIDVFTKQRNQGNPAGVVQSTEQLTTSQMQQIAKAVGFNEPFFVQKSTVADYHFRFFTPGHEMPLCGHATIGAVYALITQAKMTEGQLSIETQAGIITVSYQDEQLTMEQAPAQFQPFQGQLASLCASLAIETADLHPTLPICYGSTGTWTLLVPVKTPTVLARIQPDNHRFPAVLWENERASVHPFAVVDAHAQTFTARHFSSPFSGTIEDAVTGTASGAMAAYALKYLYPVASSCHIEVTQGQFVQRLGTVYAQANRHPNSVQTGHQAKITGTACSNRQWQVSLSEAVNTK